MVYFFSGTIFFFVLSHQNSFGVVSSETVEQQKADRAKRFGLTTDAGSATSTATAAAAATTSSKIVDDVEKDADKLKVFR